MDTLGPRRASWSKWEWSWKDGEADRGEEDQQVLSTCCVPSMELKTRVEMHSFNNKYLLNATYLLGTVLGSGDKAENERESLISWCSYSGGGHDNNPVSR